MYDPRLYTVIDAPTANLINKRAWPALAQALRDSAATGDAGTLPPLAALTVLAGNDAHAAQIAAEAVSELQDASEGFVYRAIADWIAEFSRLVAGESGFGTVSQQSACAVLAWYRMAAEAGDAEAMYQLGSWGGPLGDGKHGDAGQQSVWMRAAADAGHPGAAYPVARMHDHRDEIEDAEHWYRVAIESGAAGAADECSPEIGEAVVTLALADLFARTGNPEAETWFKHATASALDTAALRLARWYEQNERTADAIQMYEALARRGLLETPALRDYLLGEYKTYRYRWQEARANYGAQLAAMTAMREHCASTGNVVGADLWLRAESAHADGEPSVEVIAAYESSSVAAVETIPFAGGTALSPILHHLGSHLSGVLPADEFARLSRVAIETSGTAHDGLDRSRSYLALDWLARFYLPTWMDLSESPVPAATLRAAPAICDRASAAHFVGVAQPLLSPRSDPTLTAFSPWSSTDAPAAWTAWLEEQSACVYSVVQSCAGGVGLDFVAWSGADSHAQAVANRFGYSDSYWLALWAATADSAEDDSHVGAWVKAWDWVSRESWELIGGVANKIALAAVRDGASDVSASVSVALSPTIADLQDSLVGLFARMTYPS